MEYPYGFGKAWWVEMKTSQPACTYYFGPFSSEAEAESMKGGYIEDLEQEGTQNIRWVIQRCSYPEQLTITDESDGWERSEFCVNADSENEKSWVSALSGAIF